MTTCDHCGTTLEAAATGRPRRWCDDRCRRAAATTAPPERLHANRGDPGLIEQAVNALASELRYPLDDPRHVIGLLAMQVAAAIDDKPADVALTRELRLCLAHFTDSPNEPPGAVDEIRAEFLKKRVAMMLDHQIARMASN